MSSSLPTAEEAEELDPFAHSSPEHSRVARRFAEEGRNLRRAEVEPAVERLDRPRDLVTAEVRVGDRAYLAPGPVDEGGLVLEPARLAGLLIESRPRVRRGD